MSTKSNTVPATKQAPSAVDVAKQMRADNKSTSDIIRALSKIHVKDGVIDRGAIVKTLKEAGVQTKNGTPVLYQHVRNTLIVPVKKAT